MKTGIRHNPEHTDPDYPACTATIAVGGSLCVLKPGDHPKGEWKGGARGAVSTFSRASRKRLLCRLNSINRNRTTKLPLFVTLTYPAWWPTSGKVWKRDLDTWLKRLRRKYPAVSAIWKLEFQQRGAPHFHLLMWGIEFLPYGWVASSWYEVVGSKDLAHATAGTQVKRINSWRGVTYYAAKYMGKAGAVPVGIAPGRFWGVINADGLPVDLLVVRISWHSFYIMRRLVWRLLKQSKGGTGRKTRYKGATAFLQSDIGINLTAWATGL